MSVAMEVSYIILQFFYNLNERGLNFEMLL